MVELGAVTIRTPKFVSQDMAIGAVGVTGGMLFSDFMGTNIVDRLGWVGTGGQAIAGAAVVKAAVSGLAYAGAVKTSGAMEAGLYMASVGALASIVIDVYRYYKPATVSGLARGAPRVVVRAPGIVPSARVAVRPAETPSGQALGGF